MCLTLRTNSISPYNNKNIRWKVVVEKPDGYYSLYIRSNRYKEGVNSAIYKKSFGLSYYDRNTQFGFHVFVSRADARRFLKNIPAGSKIYKVVKLRVSGFLRSGYYCGLTRCETWKYLEILGKS